MKSSKVKSEKIDKSSKDVKHEEEKTLQEEYINSLSEVERSTMRIAEEHLKTSFSLRKSIGYMKWLANKK
jgi:hypothetical protein